MAMSNDDILAIIRAHRTDSLGAEDGSLSNERAVALNHYHGRPYGNEVEGRSQVVSRDLAEAVDWAMPGIMRVFTQAGRLAEFDPVGPHDEQLAFQESDYTNLVLMKDNPGFMILHDAIKDTLLLKNGYVKHFWEVEEKITQKSYSGLGMDAIVMLMRDLQSGGAEVEILGQDSHMVEMPGPAMPQGPMMPPGPPGAPMNPVAGAMPAPPQQMEVFDLKLRIKQECGKLVWMAVPSEEVRVSKRCRGSLQESPFTEHVTRKTRSDLIEMGMSREFVDALPAYAQTTTTSSQSFARDSVADESDHIGQSLADKSMDEIEYCEAYLRIDYDRDGVAELRKVVTVANKIPPGDDYNEEIPAVPMTGFVAKRVPHRHIGESLDDELADLQEIMTTLKRQLLDNIYRVNNAEMAINERANLRDFMTSTPGGIKRIKGDQPIGDSFQPIVTTPIIDKILPVLGFFEESKEVRTGISKASTGLDPDVLQNTTKGAFMENLNRASQKMEMIARMLAESGVKEAVLQAHAILIRHQDKPRVVQMRGKWIPVNPQEWSARTSLTVKVGLGTGSEDEKRQRLMLLWQLQGQLGQAFGMVGPQQAYSLFEEVSKTLGFETPEKFVMSPSSPEFRQAMQERQNKPDPKMAVEQSKLQQRGQFEQQKMAMQAQVDQNRQEYEARQHQAKIEQDAQLEQLRAKYDAMEHARDVEFQRWKAGLDAAVKIEVANIASKAKLQDQATMVAPVVAASEMQGGAPMDQQMMPPEGMGQ